MKANPHPALLPAVRDEGMEFECVSRDEVERVLGLFPELDRARVLYTPNFAPREEYAWALERGVQVTVDNLYVLTEWPELFRDREIFVRVDTGVGRGHHHHVRTAGAHAKFGVPVADLERARAAGAASWRPHRGPAGARGQRHIRCRRTGSARRASWPSLAQRFAVRVDRYRRRPRRAGAQRSAGHGSAEARYLARRGARRASGAGVLAGAWTLSGGRGRCAAGARDPVEDQGRSPLCRRRDRDELPDPAGTLWCIP